MNELTVSIKVATQNDLHTRVLIFTNSKRNGVVSVGRGLSGDLTLDTSLFEEFAKRLAPLQITWAADVPPPRWVVEEYGEGEHVPLLNGTEHWRVFYRNE